MLPFSVQIQDGMPVSEQLAQAARKAILTGQLPAGEPFPSVRTLSQELRISPTTAHKVMGMLQEAGYLASRPGIGMVVVLPQPSPVAERIEQLKPHCQSLLAEASSLNLNLDQTLDAVRQTSRETRLP